MKDSVNCVVRSRRKGIVNDSPRGIVDQKGPICFLPSVSIIKIENIHVILNLTAVVMVIVADARPKGRPHRFAHADGLYQRPSLWASQSPLAMRGWRSVPAQR